MAAAKADQVADAKPAREVHAQEVILEQNPDVSINSKDDKSLELPTHLPSNGARSDSEHQSSLMPHSLAYMDRDVASHEQSTPAGQASTDTVRQDSYASQQASIASQRGEERGQDSSDAQSSSSAERALQSGVSSSDRHALHAEVEGAGATLQAAQEALLGSSSSGRQSLHAESGHSNAAQQAMQEALSDSRRSASDVAETDKTARRPLAAMQEGSMPRFCGAAQKQTAIAKLPGEGMPSLQPCCAVLSCAA